MRQTEKTRIVNSLRESIKNVSYPLSYYDDLDFYNHKSYFNCYAYALGLKKIDKYLSLKWEGMSIYNPGTISNFKIIIYDENSLIDAFLSDCDTLNIMCLPVDINDKLDKDMGKISLYIEHENRLFLRDFHFARQNESGEWSNMASKGGLVSLISNDNIKNFKSGYDYIGSYALRRKR